MKRKIQLLITIALIFVCVGLYCSCSVGGEAGAEARSEAVASNEIGNVATEANVAVSGVSVAGDTIINKEAISFAGLLWRVYNDTFARILMVIFFLMWYTGNLAPHKNFSLWDKK